MQNKEEIAARRLKYRLGNKERIAAWQLKYCLGHKEELAEYQRQRATGITAEMYDYFKKQQKDKCAICGKKEKGGKALSVDHDHKTKKIRGLLCGTCNRAIGALGDNLRGVMRAVFYLS